MKSETPPQRDIREKLEARVVHHAHDLKERLPPNVAFALFLMEFGSKGNMAYASSGNRADVVYAMENWLAATRRDAPQGTLADDVWIGRGDDRLPLHRPTINAILVALTEVEPRESDEDTFQNGASAAYAEVYRLREGT